MKRPPWLLMVISADLVALVALAFIHPHLMISPGPLVRDQCRSCHQPPKNQVHRDLSVACRECHRTPAWKPALFDHKRYTCYGCHEHTPSKARAEHEEEGIRDFENCVECHRSPDKESAEGASNGGRDSD